MTSWSSGVACELHGRQQFGGAAAFVQRIYRQDLCAEACPLAPTQLAHVLLSDGTQAQECLAVQHHLAPRLAPEQRCKVEALGQAPAVALFAHRAARIRPDFRLTSDNVGTVLSCASGLDGLPLAIELAAARCRALLPYAILARLGHRLELLSGGAPDEPARHHTLRAALVWSYQLISAEEQAVFRRVSVFAGGCSLEAAEMVRLIGPGDAQRVDIESGEMLDLLARLVDKSLVNVQEGPGNLTRYRLLETLRQYAAEELHTAGEADETIARLVRWYLNTESSPTAARRDLRGDRLEDDHRDLTAGFLLVLGEVRHLGGLRVE